MPQDPGRCDADTATNVAMPRIQTHATFTRSGKTATAAGRRGRGFAPVVAHGVSVPVVRSDRTEPRRLGRVEARSRATLSSETERAVSAGHVKLTKTDDSRIVDLTARLVAVDAVVALTAAVSFQ